MAFQGYLRQSTAETVLIGPFVDSGDGDAEETALTIAQADVRLSKNHGNMAQKNDATSCTHDELGMYTCPLNATDTDTVGILRLMVHETGALLVDHTYHVLEEAIWDALFDTGANGFDSNGRVDVGLWLGTAPLALSAQRVVTDVGAVSGDTTSADNLELDYDGTGYNKSNSTIGTVTNNSDKTGYSISGTVTTLDGLNDLTAAEVNAEVLDVMNTDTITLPGQTAPPLAPTHRQAIGWLYKVLRNRTDQTSTLWRLYADNETTVDAKATVSEAGGTTTKQEIETGP